MKIAIDGIYDYFIFNFPYEASRANATQKLSENKTKHHQFVVKECVRNHKFSGADTHKWRSSNLISDDFCMVFALDASYYLSFMICVVQPN